VLDVLWLGLVLGAGAAVSVGPVFVTILHESATRGFAAGLRVILGSATADLVLLLPALVLSQVIATVAGASLWMAVVGALFMTGLAAFAVRDAMRLWRGHGPEQAGGWAFGKGLLSNLLNPLSWTFWLATGTPTMLRSRDLAGDAGMAVFTVTWFGVASGLEAVIALAVARSGRRVGRRGQGAFTGLSALLFAALAAMMLARAVFT
jgi:threonine/homoserine/homoserine lactone efflux protein